MTSKIEHYNFSDMYMYYSVKWLAPKQLCCLTNHLPAPPNGFEMRGGIPVAMTLGTIKVPWCS